MRWGLPELADRLVFPKKTILILVREEHKVFFFKKVVLELHLDSKKKESHFKHPYNKIVLGCCVLRKHHLSHTAWLRVPDTVHSSHTSHCFSSSYQSQVHC